MSRRSIKEVTIRQLQALAMVQRSRSITAAAKKLNLTQPAVALQLRNLQALAGVPLLQRTSEGMLLTDAGRHVLTLSDRINVALADCQSALDALTGKSAGHITIGAVSTAKYFVPYMIAGFSRSHPHVNVSLTMGNRQEIGTALLNYDLDFAIMGRPPSGIEMDRQLIGDHPHVIIAPTNHRLARKSRIRLTDLAAETFLMREPGSGTRGLMEKFLESTQFRPKIGMVMQSNETIKQAVIAGLGIAFISAHTVATELDERRLVVLDVAGMPVVRQWFIVLRKDKILMPPARAMFDFLSVNGAKFLPRTHRRLRLTRSTASRHGK